MKNSLHTGEMGLQRTKGNMKIEETMVDGRVEEPGLYRVPKNLITVVLSRYQMLCIIAQFTVVE